MLALVRPFIDICLLRRGPQDLPSSPLLLFIALVAHLCMGSLLAGLYHPAPTSVLMGAAGTALLSSLVVGILALRSLLARLTQTLTAFAGTDVVMHTIAIPLGAWITSLRSSGGDAAPLEILYYALLFWSWAVAAHILRHALTIRFGLGLLIAIVFFIISVNVLHYFFPLEPVDPPG